MIGPGRDHLPASTCRMHRRLPFGGGERAEQPAQNGPNRPFPSRASQGDASLAESVSLRRHTDPVRVQLAHNSASADIRFQSRRNQTHEGLLPITSIGCRLIACGTKPDSTGDRDDSVPADGCTAHANGSSQPTVGTGQSAALQPSDLSVALQHCT